IKDLLHPAVQLHDLRAEHDGEELRARQAVAMLARQGAAELHHQLCHLTGDALHPIHILTPLEVQIDSNVQATLPGVAEEAERGPVAVDDLFEAAGVRTQLLRGDTGIFYELLRLDVTARGRAIE